MKKQHILATSFTALITIPAHSAVVNFVGGDFATSTNWRTAGVIKPLDPDGNNIYGTDGYMLTGGAGLVSNPSYATVTRLSSLTFPGNGAYTSIDNPAGGSPLRTGVWYTTGGVTNQEHDLAQITVNVASSFRVGVLTDNADFADISPNDLRIFQTSGGVGDSGMIPAYVEPNMDTDWYFFDIINAQPGDTFTISGTNARSGSGAQDSNGIGGLTFDSVPEPSSVLLSGITALGLLLRRKR